jgi:hypothetical protein
LSSNWLGVGKRASSRRGWGRFSWYLYFFLFWHSFLCHIGSRKCIFDFCGSSCGSLSLSSSVGSAVSGGNIGRSLWLCLNVILQFLINLVDVQSRRRGLLRNGLCLWHLNVLHQRTSCRFILSCASINCVILAFFIDVAENVVQDEVTGGLLSEDKCLDELFKLGRFV